MHDLVSHTPDSKCDCVRALIQPPMVQLHGTVVQINAVYQLGVLLVIIAHIVLEDRQMLQDVVLDCRHIRCAYPVLGGAPNKPLQNC